MFRTVVAFDSENAVNGVSEILEKAGITVRYRCRTASAVVRAVNTMGGGVVICGFRFPDGTGDTLPRTWETKRYVLLQQSKSILTCWKVRTYSEFLCL